MMKLILIISLFFSQFDYKKDSAIEFSIIIGSFFQGEEISIKVGGVSLINKQKVISNTIGKVGITITQYPGYLEVFNYGKVKKYKKVKITPLQMEVSVNSQKKILKYDITKGNILFIEYNNDASGILTIGQRFEPIIFL